MSPVRSGFALLSVADYCSAPCKFVLKRSVGVSGNFLPVAPAYFNSVVLRLILGSGEASILSALGPSPLMLFSVHEYSLFENVHGTLAQMKLPPIKR
jgi:hypothetical protein